MGILENLFDKILGMEKAKGQLEKCQNGYREVSALYTEELSKNSALESVLILMQEEKQKLNEENAHLNTKLGEAEANTAQINAKLSAVLQELEAKPKTYSISSLMDKEIPAMLRIPEKGDKTYSTPAFALNYGGKTHCTYFTNKCEAMHIGGFALRYVLDPAYFKAGMSENEVTNMALKIVQEAIAYVSDEKNYGVLDSWAPGTLVFLLWQGDCNNAAQAVCEIFHTYELVYGAFKDYVCLVCIGYISAGCHAWVGLFCVSNADPEKNYFGEATYDKYTPLRTIKSLGSSYMMSLGTIGLPSKNNLTGGLAIKPECKWWAEAPGIKEGEEIKVEGNNLEKRKVLKSIWENTTEG